MSKTGQNEDDCFKSGGGTTHLLRWSRELEQHDYEAVSADNDARRVLTRRAGAVVWPRPTREEAPLHSTASISILFSGTWFGVLNIGTNDIKTTLKGHK